MKKIECIIMDWAGTAVDYGCFAPVAAFIESFNVIGTPVTAAETRAHMGLTKVEEIRALFHIDRVRNEFEKKYGRPLYNTEWLHRIYDNNVETLYPLFWLEGIGSYHYGLVEGRAQYYEPWESLRGSALPIDRWQHDIFRANHRPYSHEEIRIFKQFNDIAERQFAEKTKK